MTTQEKKHFIYNCPKVGDYLVDDISKIPSGYLSYSCSCPHTKGVYAKRALLVAHIRRQPHREWVNNMNMTLHETKPPCPVITPETPIFVPEPELVREHNEDVVDDLEGQVKRMLEFIEIPFEEECISFYETDRLVRTPSSEQVRRPVNKDGMERWKPYARYLKPLLNVLDADLLKPEDIAFINK